MHQIQRPDQDTLARIDRLFYLGPLLRQVAIVDAYDFFIAFARVHVRHAITHRDGKIAHMPATRMKVGEYGIDFFGLQFVVVYGKIARQAARYEQQGIEFAVHLGTQHAAVMDGFAAAVDLVFLIFGACQQAEKRDENQKSDQPVDEGG
ncbi:MAG TPA: hypothetical protein VK938_01295 [Methylophilaceae bacterium]|nr:hypothetical protein [Methylophilaceae bacterium]